MAAAEAKAKSDDAQASASLWQAATSDFNEDATYFPGAPGSLKSEATGVDARSRGQAGTSEDRPADHGEHRDAWQALEATAWDAGAGGTAEVGQDVGPEARQVLQGQNDTALAPAQASMSPLPGLLRPSRIDEPQAAALADDIAHDAPAVAAGTGSAPHAMGVVAPGAASGSSTRPFGDADPDSHAESDELPDFVSEDLRRQGLRRTVRPLMVSAAVLLALLLVAQVGYAFRTSIAANFPQTRPLLDDACRVIGCSVGLPTQIDSVSIESSDFQPIADKRDQFTLSVLLRNRSATVQAWPSIELTLTDTSDKVVARRVIGPRDYLPATTSPAKGFTAGSEQPVRLVYELARLTASGYRVYLFYP